MENPPTDLEVAVDSQSEFDEEDDDASLGSWSAFENMIPDRAAGSTEPSWASALPVQLSLGGDDMNHPRSGPKQERYDTQIYGDWSILIPPTDTMHGPRLRLLQIKPDTLDQPICCNLIVRPVYDTESLAYIALSYSWGNGSLSSTILIGDEANPFAVSAHLYAALRELRNEQSTLR